jgi:hypothetical protein
VPELQTWVTNTSHANMPGELGGALKELITRRMASGEAGEVTTLPTGRHLFARAP